MTLLYLHKCTGTGSRSAVKKVSGNRCESECRSKGREFDPGVVHYFHGDWLFFNFYGHSPPFCWIIQEGLLSVTSKSICTKYWLTSCSSLPRNSVARWTDRPAMTIAVDLGRKATKINKHACMYFIIVLLCFSFSIWILYSEKLYSLPFESKRADW